MSQPSRIILYLLLALLGLTAGEQLQSYFNSEPEKIRQVGHDLVSADISPDGSSIAGVGKRDGAYFLQAWDENGTTILAPQRLPAPAGRIHGLDWSPDGREVAVSAGSDVWVYSLEHGRKTVCPASPGVRTVCYDDGYLMARTPTATFLWNRRYRLHWRLEQEHLLQSALRSGRLATGCFEDGVRVFDLRKKRQLSHFNPGTTSAGLQFSADGHTLTSGFRSRGQRKQDHILSFDLPASRPAGPVLSTPGLFGFHASARGDSVVSRQQTGASVWNVRTGGRTSERPGKAKLIDVISPDGNWIATATSSGVTLWNSCDPTSEYALDFSQPVTDLSFSPSGNLLIVAGSAGLWSTP